MYDRFQMLDVEIGLPSSCKNNRSCCLACCSFDISCGKIDHKVYKYIRVKKNWAFVLANKDNTMANPEFIYAEFLLF